MFKKNKSTRELIGVVDIGNVSINTEHGELVYFSLEPTNIGVLSEDSINIKVEQLMNVLKTLGEVEIACLNSRENFDANKIYLQNRLAEENNPVIRKLLEQDSKNLDMLQVQMATAREFLLIIPLKNNDVDKFAYLKRVENVLKEQNFIATRASQKDVHRILAVYFEQNVTTDKFQSIDGELWFENEMEV